ncbi:MAG: hypothetical protein MI861_19105, partial [Pirellulales bacterium]|nr:hypothetical protein [Pirellulales bacterium]
MKLSTKTRRTLLGAVLAGTTMLSTGCSSGGFPLASLNPFSNQPGEQIASAEPATITQMTDSLASPAQSAKNQVNSLSKTAKNAWSKSTGAITGLFSRADDSDETAPASSVDPLRLDSNPASIGPEVLVANGQLW